MLVEIQGIFFNEFLVVDISMQRNDQTIHTYMTCFQNESISIQKTHNICWCDACIVYIDIAKLQMRSLHYAFLS